MDLEIRCLSAGISLAGSAPCMCALPLHAQIHACHKAGCEKSPACEAHMTCMKSHCPIFAGSVTSEYSLSVARTLYVIIKGAMHPLTASLSLPQSRCSSRCTTLHLLLPSSAITLPYVISLLPAGSQCCRGGSQAGRKEDACRSHARWQPGPDPTSPCTGPDSPIVQGQPLPRPT